MDVVKNLGEVWIQNGETMAQDREGWKEVVCIAVMDLNGLWKTEDEEEELFDLYRFELRTK